MTQSNRGHPRPAPRLGREVWHQKWVQRAIVWGGLIIAWQIFGLIRGPFYFPTFTDTVLGFFRLATEGDLLTMTASLSQLLVGFALAVLVGIPLGLVIGGSRIGEAAFGHYINALYVTSKEALLPLMIILLGVGFEYRVGVVFTFSCLYVIVSVAAGMHDVNPNLLETARSFGASRSQVGRLVAMPSMVPFLFAGFRLGYGFAIKGMILAELWVLGGTGRLLADLGLNRDLDRYFAAVVVIAFVGVAGSSGLRWIERRVAPWSESTRGLGRRSL